MRDGGGLKKRAVLTAVARALLPLLLGVAAMVLESLARIVKVQLPAYLKRLPLPESVGGFLRLTGRRRPGPLPAVLPAPGTVWGARRGRGPSRGVGPAAGPGLPLPSGLRRGRDDPRALHCRYVVTEGKVPGKG